MPRFSLRKNKKIDNPTKSSDTRLKKTFKTGTVLVAAFLIFSVGVAIGKGSLELGNLASTSANRNLPAKLNYSSLDRLYSVLKQDFDGQLNTNKLLDGAKDGLVQATGDPYTDYLSSEESKNFNESLSGSFSGIGAELGSDTENHIVVIAPLAGSPAEKAGLKSKDIIVAVNDKSTQGFI